MAALPFIELHETHTGVVVLAGDRAYKAKKPVLTDFLDFRTTEQREHACRREVELNSRLSPHSYLGIARLSDPAGGPDEPVIVMRRYGDDDRLATKVTRGENIESILDTIARVLARFHERAERGPAISAQGGVAAIDRRWSDNITELKRFASEHDSPILPESVDRVGQLAEQYLAGRTALIDRRVDEAAIIDGHGDLLAADIFWTGGQPEILDCLEFDDQLRYVDRIDDAAFLAMDLEFLGRKDLGDYFLNCYRSYAADTAPPSLRDFYIAYRAGVRAKVDCVRLTQGHRASGADAARHLAIAAEHLRDGAVRLALVGGNPGTGKSTVARNLAQGVGARVISTDDVRRELRESGAITGESGILNEGLYSPDNIAVVYTEAMRRAHNLLSHGQSVILDGTWGNPQYRAAANALARQTHSVLVEIVCSAAVDVAAERIQTRQPGTSEVTAPIAGAMAARRNGWGTAHIVDTSGTVERARQAAQEVWHQAV
ncbi:nucleoside monophosphate kinase [Mycobacterium vicinigordonae]|uniref:Nucleoside monophosphate kinase n=1 Tax=Mycobacterium vicinigordonae TaxID=1719132 RepID=A0A7D6HUI7_9MYCO|nr:bifunctional aminoglycoside phosphotransferase/ATP-binding protein [Mycobacterium vicinigordonae]QLL10311.1 nucleoside monophosphate kinase [Mycobacterium vicinigordonae]